LVEASINFGATEEGNVRFIAFLDPMCPHCNEFLKITFHVLKKSPHVGFHVIPVAILGQNSEAMAKFMIAGANQSVEKLKVFEQKFIDNIADINRQKLLDFAKSSGFDLARLEKDELSEETEKVINRNGNLAEELKIQGVPTVYVIMPDGKLSLVPPMSLDGFMGLVDDLQNKFKVGEKTQNVDSPKPSAEVKSNDSKAKETPKEPAKPAPAKTVPAKQTATPAPKEEPKADAGIKAETPKVEEVKPEPSEPEAPQVEADKPAETKDEKKS
jgi:predicted DsbA family dithiol-disulfide isomerase